MRYWKEMSYDQRKKHSAKLLAKYPDRIPIIVETPTNQDKFLVEANNTVLYLINKCRPPAQSDLASSISTKSNVNSQIAYFAIVKRENNRDIMAIPNNTIGSLHMYLNSDGFLYIKIMPETTFG